MIVLVDGKILNLRSPIRYACFFAPSHFGGGHYEYVVNDRDRDVRFSIGFETMTPIDGASYVDERRAHARQCERDLWRGVKRESPGTYLDAKAMGWVPEDVTRFDFSSH